MNVYKEKSSAVETLSKENSVFVCRPVLDSG